MNSHLIFILYARCQNRTARIFALNMTLHRAMPQVSQINYKLKSSNDIYSSLISIYLSIIRSFKRYAGCVAQFLMFYWKVQGRWHALAPEQHSSYVDWLVRNQTFLHNITTSVDILPPVPPMTTQLAQEVVFITTYDATTDDKGIVTTLDFSDAAAIVNVDDIDCKATIVCSVML